MAGILEAFYKHCPLWLQNVGISAYGYFYKRERFGPEFDKTKAGFLDRDRWPAGKMRTYVDSRLREVLVRAHDAPYYRDLWEKAGISRQTLQSMTAENLTILPILGKRDLRKNPEVLVPRHRPPGRLVSYYTSGSTGTPVRAILNSRSHQRFAAAREVRSFGWAGVSIREPRATIGGRLIVPRGEALPPFYRHNLAERQVYFSAYHIAPAHIGNYVEGFNRYQPQSVTGYSFSMFLVARMMAGQGLRFDYRPKAAITSSEKLTPNMKRTIMGSWGCRAYEEYGCVENCMLATECEEGRLHVSPDFGIVEIVDDDGQPVPPGVEGRILCTGLLNEAQHLIRYDVGDIGVWSEEKCPCGREHLPILREVVGRLEDTVVGPDGREMVRFHGIFINLPHVSEGQVIQEQVDKFTVRVIAEEGFDEAEKKEIERRFDERLGRVKVRVERVAELERGENGKLKAVISKVRKCSNRLGGL